MNTIFDTPNLSGGNPFVASPVTPNEALASDYKLGWLDCERGLGARPDMSPDYYDGYGRSYEQAEAAANIQYKRI